MQTLVQQVVFFQPLCNGIGVPGTIALTLTQELQQVIDSVRISCRIFWLGASHGKDVQNSPIVGRARVEDCEEQNMATRFFFVIFLVCLYLLQVLKEWGNDHE